MDCGLGARLFYGLAIGFSKGDACVALTVRILGFRRFRGEGPEWIAGWALGFSMGWRSALLWATHASPLQFGFWVLGVFEERGQNGLRVLPLECHVFDPDWHSDKNSSEPSFEEVMFKDVHYTGRKHARLSRFDYTRTRFYFITICTHNREKLFGKLQDGQVLLSPLGQIAYDCWAETPKHFPNAVLDEFVIMPNHMHAMVGIVEQYLYISKKETNCAKANGALPLSVSTIVGSYKSATSRFIHKLESWEKCKVWHRGFYDIVVKEKRQHLAFQRYIKNNPQSAWSKMQTGCRVDR